MKGSCSEGSTPLYQIAWPPVSLTMEESISIEETNKIRISLGLKPLTDDSQPTNDPDRQAADNYARAREDAAQNKERKYVFWVDYV